MSSAAPQIGFDRFIQLDLAAAALRVRAGVSDDLSMELVANQVVSPGWMVSGSDQFRRTVAGGL